MLAARLTRFRTVCLLGMACGLGMTSAAQADAAATIFQTRLQPFLQQYCLGCHGAEKPKGDFRVDTLHWPINDADLAEEWQQAVNRLGAGEMPPKDQKQPSAKELSEFLEMTNAELRLAAERLSGATGAVVIRRLNRTEYEHTVTDLLGGFDERLLIREMLPDDALAHGFDKVGSALSLSAEQVESYIATADVVLRSVTARSPQPPPGGSQRYSYGGQEDLDLLRERVSLQLTPVRRFPDRMVIFSDLPGVATPTRLRQFSTRYAGRYRIRIAASLYQSNDPQVLTIYTAGGRDSGRWTVDFMDVTSSEMQVAEFEEIFPPGYSINPVSRTLPDRRTVLNAGWRTNFPEGRNNYQGPGVAIHWIEVEGPIHEEWPPRGHQALFDDLPMQRVTPSRPPQDRRRPSDYYEVVSSNPADDADRLIRRFLPRAFRRPVTDQEVQMYVRMVLEEIDTHNASFQEAMFMTYQAILCSPNFLFLREQSGRIDDYAIANRLSYFLWNSMPDDELMALASQGKLQEAQVRRQQVDRMIGSPKARRFVRDFCDQWLVLKEIDFTVPDSQLYPEFDELLQDAMLQETQLFFEEMLRHDLSLLNFIDSDWTMLNRRLAEHYGLSGVRGLDFQKVKLPANSHRGGVLTHASVLKVTANGTVTSPVLRGNWILERLFNRPPPPPPPNVPAIEPDTRGASTIREQYIAHREIQACAACHAKIDPHGFALENYDVIGGWREFYRSVGAGSPVRATAAQTRVSYRQGPSVEVGDELPGGRRFNSIEQYKQLLLEEKEQIARAVTEKLLVYSIGRGLTFADRASVDDIVERISEKNYGLRSLIHEIVSSELFVTK